MNFIASGTNLQSSKSDDPWKLEGRIVGTKKFYILIDILALSIYLLKMRIYLDPYRTRETFIQICNVAEVLYDLAKNNYFLPMIGSGCLHRQAQNRCPCRHVCGKVTPLEG